MCDGSCGKMFLVSALLQMGLGMTRQGMFHVASFCLVGQVESFLLLNSNCCTLEAYNLFHILSYKSYLSKTVTSRRNAWYSFLQMLPAVGIAPGTRPFLGLTAPQL